MLLDTLAFRPPNNLNPFKMNLTFRSCSAKASRNVRISSRSDC
uniref:Uncharacterized protein n=1 Tax=Nelumbo nucifera TaxID=4432 RepID=A0A822YD47_NELNU|nr:TPA_asm: hypothetical protein HUJ06_031521 [Nelumbo nucifera]